MPKTKIEQRGNATSRSCQSHTWYRSTVGRSLLRGLRAPVPAIAYVVVVYLDRLSIIFPIAFRRFVVGDDSEPQFNSSSAAVSSSSISSIFWVLGGRHCHSFGSSSFDFGNHENANHLRRLGDCPLPGHQRLGLCRSRASEIDSAHLFGSTNGHALAPVLGGRRWKCSHLEEKEDAERIASGRRSLYVQYTHWSFEPLCNLLRIDFSLPWYPMVDFAQDMPTALLYHSRPFRSQGEDDCLSPDDATTSSVRNGIVIQ